MNTTDATTGQQEDTATVVFRLAGPMQSWGATARTHGGGGRRPSNDHPTKTGVIGFVANALGRDRADDISDLAALRYGCRADRPGTMAGDFHTAGSGDMPLTGGHLARDAALTRAADRLEHGRWPITSADVGLSYGAPRTVTTGTGGSLKAPPGGRNAVMSVDSYLADAVFIIALTGDGELVARITDALNAPARVLFLGRKAYPLTGQLLLNIWFTGDPASDPAAALTVTPLDERAATWSPKAWVEPATGGNGAATVPDQPGATVRAERGVRWEITTRLNPPAPVTATTNAARTNDPSELSILDFFTPPTTSTGTGGEDPSRLDFFTAPAPHTPPGDIDFFAQDQP